jgi:hypothetical protein
MALDASVVQHMKLPRRTKKAWRKRASGDRLSIRERARISSIERDLNGTTLTRRLVASWFRVPMKLLKTTAATAERLKEERTSHP